MRIANATSEFKAAYDKRLKQLKKIGFYQPHLSSLAKKYAALDLEVAEQEKWYTQYKYLAKVNKDLCA